MILASYRFFADLRHHGRTRDGNARRQTHESANEPWRFPPSDRSKLTSKAKARSFDARAAMKPRKAVVGRAPRGENRIILIRHIISCFVHEPPLRFLMAVCLYLAPTKIWHRLWGRAFGPTRQPPCGHAAVSLATRTHRVRRCLARCSALRPEPRRLGRWLCDRPRGPRSGR